jgi:Sec-independent protein secretion pathway component TatC
MFTLLMSSSVVFIFKEVYQRFFYIFLCFCVTFFCVFTYKEVFLAYAVTNFFVYFQVPPYFSFTTPTEVFFVYFYLCFFVTLFFWFPVCMLHFFFFFASGLFPFAYFLFLFYILFFCFTCVSSPYIFFSGCLPLLVKFFFSIAQSTESSFITLQYFPTIIPAFLFSVSFLLSTFFFLQCPAVFSILVWLDFISVAILVGSRKSFYFIFFF